MRIFAVDDDPVALDLLRVLVDQIGGHELTTSDCPVEALEIIGASQQAQFDCFLLDIDMPSMTGIELCELLRSIPAYGESPILMVTRLGEKASIDDAFKAGATDYLNKPFELGELKGRINILTKAVKAAAKRTDKIFAVKDLHKTGGSEPREGLHTPIPIDDVRGFVTYTALENYVAQLSRNSLFGSTVFALKLLDVQRLYEDSSAFEFRCFIVDAAEAVSDCFEDRGALIAYSGSGTFACVVDDGWRPDLREFVDRVNSQIEMMDLHFNDGRSANLSLCAGRPVRLLSRAGSRAIDALCLAQESAEEVCRQMEYSPLGLAVAKHSA